MHRSAKHCLGIGLLLWATAPSGGATQPYPFEGTWVRVDRTCSAKATLVRTYTAREVTSVGGHCAIRRVTSGSNEFELLEDCHRGERTATVTETIRMGSPDAMTLRRQVKRLKIARGVRYARCSVAAPLVGGPPHRASPSVPDRDHDAD